MYYIYILFSRPSNVYYVGYSENPQRRLEQHNSKEEGTYTSKHIPWELLAVFEIGKVKGEAIRIERFIKRQKSKKLIVQLIEKDFSPRGKLSQMVRVPHMRD